MREKCENCRFYKEDTGTKGGGQCLRFPPLPTTHTNGTFPEVWGHLWCGEYKKADDEN